MGTLTLLDTLATPQDWVNDGNPWTVTLSQASYIAKGVEITITDQGDDRFSAEMVAKSGTGGTTTLGKYDATYLPRTGYLLMSSTTETRTLTQQGTCWEAGTPVNVAFVILFFREEDKEEDKDIVHKQIASLTYIGDPEDAGVMAAEAGDGGGGGTVVD